MNGLLAAFSLGKQAFNSLAIPNCVSQLSIIAKQKNVSLIPQDSMFQTAIMKITVLLRRFKQKNISMSQKK